MSGNIQIRTTLSPARNPNTIEWMKTITLHLLWHPPLSADFSFTMVSKEGVFLPTFATFYTHTWWLGTWEHNQCQYIPKSNQIVWLTLTPSLKRLINLDLVIQTVKVSPTCSFQKHPLKTGKKTGKQFITEPLIHTRHIRIQHILDFSFSQFSFS